MGDYNLYYILKNIKYKRRFIIMKTRKDKLTINDYEITREGEIINKHTGHILLG